MKILQCSDAHADWRTAGVCRHVEVADAFLQTVKTAVEEDVDLYLFTGDLSDPDDGPRALRAVGLAIEVAVKLAEAGIPSWWVPGNHDVIEDGRGESTLSPLAELRQDRDAYPEILVFDRPAVYGLPGRCKAGPRGMAVLLPYPAATNPYDPKAFVRENRGAIGKANAVLVAGHLQVEGATPGDETSEMARGRDVFFPFQECSESWLLVNGHYHHGQVFERHGRRLYVPGSLVRLNHGEDHCRPRYMIYEI